MQRVSVVNKERKLFVNIDLCRFVSSTEIIMQSVKRCTFASTLSKEVIQNEF